MKSFVWSNIYKAVDTFLYILLNIKKKGAARSAAPPYCASRLMLSHGFRVRSRGWALRLRRDGNASKPSTWKPPHARAVMAERRHAELLRSSVCGGLRTWPNDCPTSVCAWHACAAHHDACGHRSTAAHVPLELPKTVVGRAWAVAAFVAWRALHWLGNPTPHESQNRRASRGVFFFKLLNV